MAAPSPEPQWHLLDTRLEYRGFLGCASHCRLRVFHHRGLYVVLLTEERDNPGTSVTNAIEGLADLVVRRWNLHPDDAVFVEHYPARPGSGARLPEELREETLDLVEFDRSGNRLAGPRWRRIDAAAFSRLIGRKWIPECYSRDDGPPADAGGDGGVMHGELPRRWWEGTPLEEPIRLLEKADDARNLRERCEADLLLAREAAARGDRQGERFYLLRAVHMISRAEEIQDNLERELDQALRREPRDDAPGEVP